MHPQLIHNTSDTNPEIAANWVISIFIEANHVIRWAGKGVELMYEVIIVIPEVSLQL